MLSALVKTAGLSIPSDVCAEADKEKHADMAMEAIRNFTFICIIFECKITGSHKLAQYSNLSKNLLKIAPFTLCGSYVLSGLIHIEY